MLTKGNKKLGKRLIWGFTLPSGTDAVCPGRTAICSRHCYSKRLEMLRPKVHKAYQRNLLLTQRKDFTKRVYHFLRANRIRVVRIHCGGDFGSAEYAHKWLRIIQRSPRVRFFYYSRSWRDPSIRLVLEQMAGLQNCSSWFSCDAETGLPADVPPRIRLAWLQVDANDIPPATVHLVFRDYRLRKQRIVNSNGAHVCPEQDGIPRTQRITCEECRWCFSPNKIGHRVQHRLALPLVSEA